MDNKILKNAVESFINNISKKPVEMYNKQLAEVIPTINSTIFKENFVKRIIEKIESVNDFVAYEMIFTISNSIPLPLLKLELIKRKNNLINKLLKNPKSISYIKESVLSVLNEIEYIVIKTIIHSIKFTDIYSLPSILNELNSPFLVKGKTFYEFSFTAFIPILEEVIKKQQNNNSKSAKVKQFNSRKSRISREFKDSMLELENKKLKQEIQFLKSENEILKNNQEELLKQQKLASELIQ